MKRFSNILLTINADADNAFAMERAITLARNNQASLTVCSVVAEVPTAMHAAVDAVTPAELLAVAVRERREELEETVDAVDEKNLSIAVKVRVGKPSHEVIRQVLEDGHDLVIKSAEGETVVRNTLFGGTDMQLMRRCPCPVWIIKSTEAPNYRRILAAVDMDTDSADRDVLNHQILEMATSLALAESAELHVVHVWSLYGESIWRSARSDLSSAEIDAMVAEEANARRLWLKNMVATYGTEADKDATDYVKPRLHVIKGDAKHIIPATAQDLDVDLIVMGTAARGGIPGFLIGNTAENILNQISCSVLTIKPPDFVSPVRV